MAQHLAGLGINGHAARLRLAVFALPEGGVAGKLLDHAVGGTGDDHRVHRVVQVSVLPDLRYAPALAHIGSHRAVYRGNPLFPALVRGGKFQVIPYIIEQKAGHGLGVLQIPFFEILLILRGKALFQQQPFLPLISDGAVHPNNKVLSPLPGQILQGQAVSLVPVLLRQHQHLVFIAVVKAEAVRHNVVHLGIVGREKPGKRHLFLGIGTDAALLLIQLQLDQILACGVRLAVFVSDPLHGPLIFGPVFIHLLFQLLPLGKVFCHLSGQLDIDRGGACPLFADNGVDHLDGLGDGAKHNRACDLVLIIRQRGQCKAFFSAFMAPEIIARGGTGLIIIHSLFQIGDQPVAGFYGQVPEFGEIQSLKLVDQDLRDTRVRKTFPHIF